MLTPPATMSAACYGECVPSFLGAPVDHPCDPSHECPFGHAQNSADRGEGTHWGGLTTLS